MRRFAAIACVTVLAFVARAEETSSPLTEAMERLEAWDVDGAEQLAREIERTNPNDPGTKFLLGRVAFERGDYQKAVDLLGAALGPGADRSEDMRVAKAVLAETKGFAVDESEHFSIRYRPGKDAALVPYALDSMEAAYRALTADLGYKPPHKVRIEIYSSPKALARVSSLTEEAIRTTGTIALCKYNRLMVTTPRALVHGYEWQDTLTHEFVHFLVTRKSRNTVPIWLHEGIAKYLETRWRGKAGLALEPWSEAMLARAVKKDALISFERMHPSIALLPSQEDAALAFAEVFTAIEFIDHKAGMAGVRTVIEKLEKGSTDRAAVAAALGGTFEQFESAWKKALKARPAPKGAPEIEKLVFKDEKDEKGKPREKAWERGELGHLGNDDAKRHAHLGELLRQRGRMRAAIAEYEKAIALAGPTHPPLARKYALAKMAVGEAPQAEKVLRASLEARPEDSVNHLLLGRVLVQANRHAEARSHLEIAIQKDPFDPEVHEALVAVGVATKDDALANRERDVLKILEGQKVTWKAPAPGAKDVVGYLRIEEPPGYRVLVDGTATGLTTPVSELELPAGSHSVRLEKDGAAAVERSVVIGPDELVPFPGT